MSRAKTILVLDDSEIVLQVIEAELSAVGFNVLTADSLAQFDALRRDAVIDFILLDVQMPEMFGDELGLVLKDVYGLSCPVYLLSSLDANELERRAAQSGLDGYICKSDGMDHLVQRVIELLS